MISDDLTVDEQTITGERFEYRARVVVDTSGDADSPREWCSNVARLCLSHRRYDLPWEDDTAGERVQEAMDRGGLRLAARYLSVVHDAVVLPVWGYEHGAITFSAGQRTGAYRDVWDSGLAGLAYITRDVARAELRTPGEGETLDDVAEQAITGEVETYAAWSRGEVYGWIVERRPLDEYGDADELAMWEDLDSVWGYVGETEYPMSEAVSTAESYRREDDQEAATDQAETDDAQRTELGSVLA
jgi:hypothetical protein